MPEINNNYSIGVDEIVEYALYWRRIEGRDPVIVAEDGESDRRLVSKLKEAFEEKGVFPDMRGEMRSGDEEHYAIYVDKLSQFISS